MEALVCRKPLQEGHVVGLEAPHNPVWTVRKQMTVLPEPDACGVKQAANEKISTLTLKVGSKRCFKVSACLMHH